jgi:hypothetical protein
MHPERCGPLADVALAVEEMNHHGVSLWFSAICVHCHLREHEITREWPDVCLHRVYFVYGRIDACVERCQPILSLILLVCAKVSAASCRLILSVYIPEVALRRCPTPPSCSKKSRLRASLPGAFDVC